jgi:hypothetical protein
VIRFGFTQDIDKILDQLETLPDRLALAEQEAGAMISARLADEVRKKIPSGGGWLDIYRDAIEYIELGKGNYGILGVAEVSFTNLEAETTLLWFQGGDQASQVLAQYNPWPIDALPAVKGGIASDALVKPASESEVTHHRQRIAGSLSSIVALIARVGANVDPNGLVSINGQVFADLDFMARRLEFGLGGFPKVPHWLPALQTVDKIVHSEGVAKVLKKALEEGRRGAKSPVDGDAANRLKTGSGGP